MSYWPLQDLSINQIFLDQKNIRLPISDVAQDALIQDLFINEDALEIARSISMSGMFPDEFPIVAKEDGKYVMIEGNRRLAALKALNEPDLVPTFKQRIKNLHDPEIKVIKVVVAPDRETAIQFTANRHTINYRKAWKPLRQAYFYYSQILSGKTISQLLEEYPDQEVPKFIKMLEMYKLAKAIKYSDPKIELLVLDERKFPITNLERMYNDSYVREYLKISFNSEGKVQGHTNLEKFLASYARIVSDVASGEIDSRKYNTEVQRKKYIDDLVLAISTNTNNTTTGGDNESTTDDNNSTDKNNEDEFDTDDLGDVDNDKSNKDSNQSSSKSKTSKKRSSKKPKVLKGLIPSYINFGLENASLNIIFNELRDIDVSIFPNAAHDLLRSFLEASLAFYLKELKELTPKSNGHNPTLDEMLAYVASGKCSTLKDNSLIQTVDHLRQKYNKNYSLVRMNMINHNEQWNSSEREVRDAWGKLESFMKVILKSDN